MNKTTYHFNGRKVALAIGLSITATLFAAPVAAQVLVADVGMAATQNTQLAKQVLQLGKEVETAISTAQSAVNTYTTLQNILMQAQSLGSNITLFDSPMTEIQEPQISQVIDSACPGASGGNLLGSALNALGSALSQNTPIATRQQQICAVIVNLQIDEYNKTVKALNAIGYSSNTTLNKLNNLIASVNTLGTTSSATTQATGAIATLTGAMSTWQTQMKADEATIKTLQQQQSTLAKVAMYGNNTVLGNVVQAAALKAAFTINQ